MAAAQSLPLIELGYSSSHTFEKSTADEIFISFFTYFRLLFSTIPENIAGSCLQKKRWFLNNLAMVASKLQELGGGEYFAVCEGPIDRPE